MVRTEDLSQKFSNANLVQSSAIHFLSQQCKNSQIIRGFISIVKKSSNLCENLRHLYSDQIESKNKARKISNSVSTATGIKPILKREICTPLTIQHAGSRCNHKPVLVDFCHLYFQCLSLIPPTEVAGLPDLLS